MCVLHRPDQHDGSQEKRQQSLQAEPPLSPWSSTADPDGMLSDYGETFECIGLDGASDDDREANHSIGNNEYDEPNYSDMLSWKDETKQEEEHVASDTAEPGSLATVPIHSPSSQDDVPLETPDAVPESPNICAEPFQARRDPIEALEQIGEHTRSGRPVGLRLFTNCFGLQPPSIIVSNNASDEVADGNPPVLSRSYDSVDLPMVEIDMKRDAGRPSNKSGPPLQRHTRPGGQDGYSPNNYEMATQDRQPPNIPSDIDPQSEQIVNRLNAFNADVDLTAADATATTFRVDADLARFNRRRLSESHPVLQTPTNNLPLLQHWQNSSSNPPAFPTHQHRLQVPIYPTPPLSFQGSSAYQRHDSPFTTDGTLSTQPTPSPNGSTEPSSPFSLSPSTLTGADDDITCCPNCPEVVFTGSNQKNSLRRHQRDKHRAMERLECSGCAVTFAPGRKDNLLKHVRATHPDHLLPPPSKKRKRKLDSG